MGKKHKSEIAKKSEINDEETAFEIIELAIDDINILTRAFQVINNICEELSVEECIDEGEDASPEAYLH